MRKPTCASSASTRAIYLEVEDVDISGSTIALASNRPRPQGFEQAPAGSGARERLSSFSISPGLPRSSGLAEMASAIAADTCGAAIDVPSMAATPEGYSLLG